MSRESAQEIYEDIALKFFAETLRCRMQRKTADIPVGLENLCEDGLTVLAFLQELSSEHAALSLVSRSEDLLIPAEPEIEVANAVAESGLDIINADPTNIDDKSGENSDVVEGQVEAPIAQDGGEIKSEAEIVEAKAAIVELRVEETIGERTDNQAPKEDDALIIGPGGIPKIESGKSLPKAERVDLKNGKSGQVYETEINGYSCIEVINDAGTGLSISTEGQVFADKIPAGDYLLELKAKKMDRPVTISVRLAIIADPRDLWKSIASDQAAPLAKADEGFESQLGQGLIAAASKRGRSHAQEGKYRDDDFRIRADIETGWHFLIVADGAGSAELSREGSRIACVSVLNSLPALLAEKVDPFLEETFVRHAVDPDAWAAEVSRDLLYPVLPEVAFRAAQAIDEAAIELKRTPQDFSTTIVIAISRKVANRWFTASFTVGDGGVAIFDTGAKTVTVMCRPDSGEFAGQTRFLAKSEFSNSDDVIGRIFVDLREEFTVLAAMTDGITDPIFPTDAAFANPDVWVAFWHKDLSAKINLNHDNATLQDQMLSWLDFWSRGNHDDRTIALLIPQPQSTAAALLAPTLPDNVVDPAVEKGRADIADDQTALKPSNRI